MGAGEVTINSNIDVHGGGDDAADTVARKLSELLPSHLSSLFEQMAIEGGVA